MCVGTQRFQHFRALFNLSYFILPSIPAVCLVSGAVMVPKLNITIHNSVAFIKSQSFFCLQTWWWQWTVTLVLTSPLFPKSRCCFLIPPYRPCMCSRDETSLVLQIFCLNSHLLMRFCTVKAPCRSTFTSFFRPCSLYIPSCEHILDSWLEEPIVVECYNT